MLRTTDRPVVLCFIDLQQRPSRRYLVELASRHKILSEKGIYVVAIQVYKLDLVQYKDWLVSNKVELPIHIYQGDFDTDKTRLGIKSLPWLMLTDSYRRITAEGLAIEEIGRMLGL